MYNISYGIHYIVEGSDLSIYSKLAKYCNEKNQ